MRQFLQADTSKFTTRFGNQSAGAKVFTVSKVLDYLDGAYWSTLIGTATSFTATVTLADGT